MADTAAANPPEGVFDEVCERKLGKDLDTLTPEETEKYTGSASCYTLGRTLGNGSFGVVTEARHVATGQKVAIKRVFQDPMYKNRELEVMRTLTHPNIVKVYDFFFTRKVRSAGEDTDENDDSQCTFVDISAPGGRPREGEGIYLNLVMEHVPETVYRVIRSFSRHGVYVPIKLIKLYTFQLCKCLGHMHACGVCHRDIKPQNLLVDPSTHTLKLCDFGSAKRLVKGDKSVSYICSRFYRAPELMLGATDYTTAIDIWSLGCVLGELLLGKPLFAGDSSVDQLVKIIQLLGTPTRDQMAAMNSTYSEFKFPDVKSRPWDRIFNAHVPPSAIDLLSQFLCYEPQKRIKPLEALAHEFFDELFKPTTRLQNGNPLPPLLPLSRDEASLISKKAQKKLETLCARQAEQNRKT